MEERRIEILNELPGKKRRRSTLSTEVSRKFEDWLNSTEQELKIRIKGCGKGANSLLGPLLKKTWQFLRNGPKVVLMDCFLSGEDLIIYWKKE